MTDQSATNPSASESTARLPSQEDAPSSPLAAAQLLPVLAPGELNKRIGGLERQLANTFVAEAADLVAGAGMTTALLQAALVVRRDVGRINDLIHALAISITLQSLPDVGLNERIEVAPSLGAGNDAEVQQFDLQTTHRCAEFKLAVWTGQDTSRKRSLFSDYVNLVAHAPAGRSAQLFVVGQRPKHG